MSQTSTHLVSPTVRIHRSSPTPSDQQQRQQQQQQQQHFLQLQHQQQQMLAQSPFLSGGWNEYNGGFLSAIPKAFKDQRYHKRASSGSSVASAGPPSPMNQNTIYPHIATSDSGYSPSYDFDFSQTPRTSKSLPNSANDNNIMYPRAQFGAVDMRRIHSSGADERASYTMSGPQSVSSMSQNSPATPHTNYETDYDDAKNVYGEDIDGDVNMEQYLQFDAGYPSSTYQPSMQDAFAVDQFSPMAYQQPQQSISRVTPQSHRQTMMTDRLQAANQDHLRTNSPTSNPRDKSPFRQSSPYNVNATPQRAQPIPALQKSRTSVSPKEIMFGEHDIDESNATPLFQDQPQNIYPSRRQPSALSNFYTSSYNAEPSMQIPQQYPFMSQQSRQESSSGMPESTPDFPAHMLSMESTAEEGPSMPSSQQSMADSKPSQLRQSGQPTMQRPVNTSSDAGTYSCTYHGCALRFDTPAKLQKHKREGHRQLSPTGPTSPSMGLRNSQAGPHRCDRLNPSTGKPCNSIFSRPYDLTRHEDTIHNARKLKVRCQLCTEEKTFSRNDALTRHMRVVHPDVDWVGKQKRKSQK